jgi:hypothetical protein
MIRYNSLERFYTTFLSWSNSNIFKISIGVRGYFLILIDDSFVIKGGGFDLRRWRGRGAPREVGSLHVCSSKNFMAFLPWAARCLCRDLGRIYLTQFNRETSNFYVKLDIFDMIVVHIAYCTAGGTRFDVHEA